MARDVRKFVVILACAVALLPLLCCLVSMIRPIVLQLNEQTGGTLHRGMLEVVALDYVRADVPLQPSEWSIPGIRVSRSPSSAPSTEPVFHFWPGTTRVMTVRLAAVSVPSPYRIDFLRINGWLFGGVPAVFPCVAFLRGPCRRYRRRRRGRCARCGYDLTANTSGVCPECGEPAES